MAESEQALTAERREFELARCRDFLRKVADATPALVVVVDQASTVAGNSVNKSFERTIGWMEQEMLGRSFLELFRPGERERARLGVAAAFAGDKATERLSLWRTRDGSERAISWTATQIVDMTGRDLVLVCGVDITDRRRQEDELRASRTRIVEAAEDARRVLERNLHDGAQQSLVTLSLTLRQAQTRLDSDPAEARRLLEESREELAHALAPPRELPRGTHPAVRSDPRPAA